MLNNFIYAKKKSLFTKELEVGNILNEAIVFIEDTKEIWNHGTYFDCSTISLDDYAKLSDISGKLSKTEAESTYTKKLTHDILSSKVDSLSTVVEGLTTSSSGIVDLGVNPNLNTVTQPGIYKGITRQTEAKWDQSYTSFILIVTNDLPTTNWVNNYIETNQPYGFTSGWVRVGVIQTMFYTYNYPMNDHAAYGLPDSAIKTRTGYGNGSSYTWRSWKHLETTKEILIHETDTINGYYYPDNIYLYGIVNSILLTYGPGTHFTLDISRTNKYPCRQYSIYFTAGDDCSIALHKDFLIANGEIPVLQAGVHYEMSVVCVRYLINGSWKEECKIAIVPFKAPLS